MKIGMNMLLWTNHITEEHYHIVDNLKETGYDGIELYMGDGDVSHYTKLGNHFADLGLGVTTVTGLAPEENISSEDAAIQQVGLDRLKWAIDNAAALGAENI